MADDKKKVEIVENSIELYDDFPKPGIKFLDIFSVLRDAKAFCSLHELFLSHLKTLDGIDVIAALESRGFLFGPTLALELGLPFIPIRKKGKLPGDVSTLTFDLEYGSDTFEVQTKSIHPKQNVVIIDDVLATGGSLAASCDLVSRLGAKVIQCVVAIEVMKLKGRKKIPVPVHSFIEYNKD